MNEEQLPIKKESTDIEIGKLTREQIELIKRTVAKGTTDDELQLFLYTAKRTGLDPLIKQIYAIKRWSKKDNRETMTIQTGIDGYRLIAERTRAYAPGKAAEIQDRNGKLFCATAYVKKEVRGIWHEISATAFYDEYVQRNPFWDKMPCLMLAKCAEALALRKGFPAEIAGIYTHEEVGDGIDAKPDLPKGKEDTKKTPPLIQKEAPKKQEVPPQSNQGNKAEEVTFIPHNVQEKTSKNGKAFWIVTDQEGVSYFTFSRTVYEAIAKAKEQIDVVFVTYEKTQYGLKILEAKILDEKTKETKEPSHEDNE